MTTGNGSVKHSEGGMFWGRGWIGCGAMGNCVMLGTWDVKPGRTKPSKVGGGIREKNTSGNKWEKGKTHQNFFNS